MVKVPTLLLLMLGLPKLLFSQNLVPNSSFECGIDNCDATGDANDFDLYVCDWSCPTLGTSDVFSTLIANKTCFSSAFYYAPNPLSYRVGSQLPRTGNRFAGIIPYRENSFFSYREYLQVELSSALIPGEYYCAEMYVSSADIVNFSCNNLAMYFSESKQKNVQLGPLPYSPQIVEKNIINDTVNWVRVSGTFKATSSAKYLIIGNFNGAAETQLVLKTPLDVNYDFAYYFIDDVSVEHLGQKSLTYSGNTEICQGETVAIRASEGFDTYAWSTLADTLTILSSNDSLKVSPQATTQYRLVVRNCQLSIKDTFTITVNTFQKVELGKDTTICEGYSIKLNAGAPGSKYTWQDNSSSQYLNVNKAGTYSVTVSNSVNNCKGYDEINISVKTVPKVELGNDMIVCKDFFPLKAGGGNSLYEWSTGSPDSVFTPSKTGKYWVIVENQCGQSRDSINIYSASDIIVPNVITVNGDRLNDEFQLAVIEDASQMINTRLDLQGRLNVFDRWGKEIFSDANYISGWPLENDDLASGVYYFTFSYSNCPTYKGWIHVLK